MCVFLCVRVCVCVTVAHMMPCWVYQPAGCTDTVLKWGSICWVSCVPSFLTHTRTPHYVTSSFRLEPNTTLPVFHRWMFEVYHLATTKCGQRNYFPPKYFWKINFCCHFVVQVIGKTLLVRKWWLRRGLLHSLVLLWEAFSPKKNILKKSLQIQCSIKRRVKIFFKF